MNVHNFHHAFEEMRKNNLGRSFERRELELIALKYGISFNSTMWACGLGNLFIKGRLGSKYVYIFRNSPTTLVNITRLNENIIRYKNDNNRTIEHAKAILRRFGVHRIN